MTGLEAALILKEAIAGVTLIADIIATTLKEKRDLTPHEAATVRMQRKAAEARWDDGEPENPSPQSQ